MKLDKRRNILKQFKNTIKDNKVIFQENDDLSTIPFISIKLQDLSKQDIMNSFSINNIDIRDYYNPPIHKQLFFENEKKLDLTVTEDLCTKVISLPLHDDFTSVEIKRLANVLV